MALYFYKKHIPRQKTKKKKKKWKHDVKGPLFFQIEKTIFVVFCGSWIFLVTTFKVGFFIPSLAYDS